MVLKYSVALDLFGPAADRHPTARDCWELVRSSLSSMNEGRNLPPAEELNALWGAGVVDLQGEEDLDVRWALEEGPRTEWAFHLMHPGREDERLVWRLDVVCRQNEDASLRVGVRLDVSALDGGARPYDFQVSSPRIVWDLLGAWRAERTGLTLGQFFSDWRQFARLRGLLADPERGLPVVLAGPKALKQAFPPRLHSKYFAVSRGLAGSAALVALPREQDVERFNSRFDSSLRYDIEDDFAIYWPIERGSLANELKERRKSIRSDMYDNERSLAQDLLERVAARSILHDPGRITSYDAISRRKTELKRKRGELVALGAQERENELFAQLVDMEERVQELEDELAKERQEKANLVSTLHARQAARKSSGASGRLDWNVLRSVRQVRSVLEAVRLAQDSSWFDGRLVFTDASTKKAGRCTYGQPQRVLEILGFASGEYLDAIRSGATGATLTTLAEQSGFQLAPVEKGTTRKNESMMRQRDVVVDGETVRCEAHFKEGRGVDDELLRIHFCIRGQEGRQNLVIGHVGGHLETAGTRRV